MQVLISSPRVEQRRRERRAAPPGKKGGTDLRRRGAGKLGPQQRGGSSDEGDSGAGSAEWTQAAAGRKGRDALRWREQTA